MLGSVGCASFELGRDTAVGFRQCSRAIAVPLKSLRDTMELNSLFARVVNVLGRHAIRAREQARQANVLGRLGGGRDFGRKTTDEIARWMGGTTQPLIPRKTPAQPAKPPEARSLRHFSMARCGLSVESPRCHL